VFITGLEGAGNLDHVIITAVFFAVSSWSLVRFFLYKRGSIVFLISPIFSFSTLAVYPVSVTTYQYYFHEQFIFISKSRSHNCYPLLGFSLHLCDNFFLNNKRFEVQ